MPKKPEVVSFWSKVTQNPLVVFINPRTFPGIGSHGHFYGSLEKLETPQDQWDNLTRVDVVRKLSRKDALILNKMEDDRLFPSAVYKPGQESERFDTEAQLLKAAATQVVQHFPKILFLLKGNRNNQEPFPVIWARAGIPIHDLNAIAADYDVRADEARRRSGKDDTWDYYEELSIRWIKLFETVYKEATK